MEYLFIFCGIFGLCCLYIAFRNFGIISLESPEENETSEESKPVNSTSADNTVELENTTNIKEGN